jgi:ribosomal protein S18 acetylase RimI-like enzyme
VCRPPGSYPMSGRRQLRAAPSMTRLALRIGMRDMWALAGFGAGLVRAFPPEPVWYLEVLGVHPAVQRRGIGAVLLRPVLQVSDADGVGCYLETGKPDNVAYYERLGFGLVAPASPLYDGGPTMWRMLRPPQSTAGDPAPKA